MTLKKTIEGLAQEFADGIMQAIRSASLQELLSEGTVGGSAGATSTSGRRGLGRPKGSGAAAATKQASSAPKAKTKGGNLVRRSDSDLQHVVGLLVATLGNAKEGMRSEDLQKALKLSKKEILRPLNIALESKRVTKKGQKRGTRYFSS